MYRLLVERKGRCLQVKVPDSCQLALLFPLRFLKVNKQNRPVTNDNKFIDFEVIAPG